MKRRRKTAGGRGNRKGKTSAPALVLAWSIVGIPLAFGVIETLRNAIKLFH